MNVASYFSPYIDEDLDLIRFIINTIISNSLWRINSPFFKKKFWLVCERFEAFTHDFTHFIGIYAQINPHLRAREEGFEA